MEIRWDPLKNERLQRVRGISFEELLSTLCIAIEHHPQRPAQEIMAFWHQEHVWIMPFVRDGEGVFLKTIYPSQKYTRLYRKGLWP